MQQKGFLSNVVPPAKMEESLGGVKVETLRNGQCALCTLDAEEKELYNPKMKADGKKESTYYILGEAPGADEDERGRPFVGKSGRYLRSLFPPEVDVRIWNTVRCRPPSNRTPTMQEIECCRSFIEEDITSSHADTLLLVGGQAFYWATGVMSYQRFLGQWFSVKIHEQHFWAMVVPHPAYVLRQKDKQDSWEGLMLERGVSQFFEDSPYEYLGDPQVVELDDVDKNIQVISGSSLDDISKIKDFIGDESDCASAIAVDLETVSGETGERVFRPYGKGTEIVCIGMCNTRGEVMVVNNKTLFPLVVGELLASKGGLIAHNLAFDLEWMMYFYREWGGKGSLPVDVDCTRAMAFLLNEKAPLGLGDLSAVHLGLRDLKGQSGVDVTQLDQEDPKLVARYCGRDAAMCMELYKCFMDRLFSEGLWGAYRDHVGRIVCQVATQMVGLDVDTKEAGKLLKMIVKAKKEVQNEVNDMVDALEYDEEVNPGSPKQVKKFLNHLGYKVPNTSETTLQEIDHEFCELVLEHRGLTKTSGTYVEPLTKGRLWPDGKAHPLYHFSKVKTQRSSCVDPNIQNQPKRDPKAYKMIRDLILAPDEHVLLAMDYGQLEARVVAMASQDDYLVKAIREDLDIHSYWAKRIVDEWAPYHPRGEEYAHEEKYFKELRDKVKVWVFGNLYGSGLDGAVAHVGAPKHIVKDLYDEFWDQMPGVKQWHKSVLKQYDREGEVRLLTGFRRHGPMRYHEIVNTPIQGTAFAIVCEAYKKLVEASNDYPELCPVLQVHDDLTFIVHEKVAEQRMYDIRDIVLSDVDEGLFHFINVPLQIEFSMGKKWGSMKELETFRSE